MIAHLEVEEGNAQGKTFELRPGDQIGRTQGNILIDDSRISALHAQVEIDQRNHLALIDLNSSNGLQINGQKVKRVALLPGVRFLLGKTPVRVTKVDDLGNLEKNSWRSMLSEFCQHFDKFQFQPPTSTATALQAFSPALRLTFSQGVLFGHVWTLGFGPREVGSQTRDLLIGDPSLPAVAFHLLPTVGGAEIVAHKSCEILVNDQPTKRKILQEKDKITCGKHVMIVEFIQ